MNNTKRYICSLVQKVTGCLLCNLSSTFSNSKKLLVWQFLKFWLKYFIFSITSYLLFCVLFKTTKQEKKNWICKAISDSFVNITRFGCNFARNSQSQSWNTTGKTRYQKVTSSSLQVNLNCKYIEVVFEQKKHRIRHTRKWRNESNRL